MWYWRYFVSVIWRLSGAIQGLQCHRIKGPKASSSVHIPQDAIGSPVGSNEGVPSARHLHWCFDWRNYQHSILDCICLNRGPYTREVHRVVPIGRIASTCSGSLRDFLKDLSVTGSASCAQSSHLIAIE